MTDKRRGLTQRGLTRRDLLRLGAVAGPAALVAACGWDGGPSLEPKLRAFSRINDWIGEKILLSPARLAPVYPVSARTAFSVLRVYVPDGANYDVEARTSFGKVRSEHAISVSGEVGGSVPTATTCPVTNADASDARNTAARP